MSSQRTVLSRQWIPMVGGSCDVRMGYGALASAAKVLRDSVGQPHLCVIVAREGEDDAIVEELTRQATSVGFSPHVCELADPIRTLSAVVTLAEEFARIGVTSDDLCCAVGDADIISVATCVCGSWCQSTSLVAMPLDELGLLEGALVPRAIDVGDARGAFAVRSCARHALLDFDVVLRPLDDESSRCARVLMASAAMASSERDFSELWDRAGDVMAGSEDARRSQLLDTAKARGKLSASTAAAVRESLEYGQVFALACADLVPDIPRSDLIGEGMRFFARIAVAQGKLSLDDMLAQDELLDALGISVVSCDVEPDALYDALEAQRRNRSRRVLWEIPFALGRVRLATVEEHMLKEHIGAWCASRKM